jgi:D-alanyl-D-alanine carboxypeptidase/D-alanyl-D-alanine-endopeptidase (penicillin-binding protein 4)
MRYDERTPVLRLARYLAKGSFSLALALASPCRAEPAAAAPVPAAPTESSTKAIQQAVAELSDWVSKNGGVLGASVVDLASGERLGASAEHTPLNPASNQKLLTAAAALARLGPDFRFTTGLYGKVREGVVEKLVLRGNGDPSLESEHLSRLARALVDLGATRIEGDVLVDQSRFDARFVPPAFEQQPDEWSSFRAPVSAVALERNALTLDVIAQREGAGAKVVVLPGGFARVENAVKTTAPGSGQAVHVTLRPEGTRLVAALSGHVAEGVGRVRLTRRIDDPRLFSGYVLADMLRGLGVEVRGTVREGGADVVERLAFHQSAPLGALVYELGKSSDNFYAEMILKALGAQKGLPGTSPGGAEMVVEWLREVGALDPGTVVKNGSGLFEANRVSAATLAGVLSAAYRDPAIGPEFVAQLAIGGVDGTLRSRFRAHKKTRRIRAKTGTLAKVVSLGGYVQRSGGKPPLAFAFIVSGLPGKQREARDRIDAVVEKLAAAAR